MLFNLIINIKIVLSYVCVMYFTFTVTKYIFKWDR